MMHINDHSCEHIHPPPSLALRAAAPQVLPPAQRDSDRGAAGAGLLPGAAADVQPQSARLRAVLWRAVFNLAAGRRRGLPALAEAHVRALGPLGLPQDGLATPSASSIPHC